jgi:prepilin-type N-terminal cleavage/methylation domain-containing protein
MNKKNVPQRGTRPRRKKILAKEKGFTLIEILVVIGIIAVLALIVLVAINPARQFAQARNTQRTSNVEAVLNAIGQNVVDNKGAFTCSNGAVIPTDSAPGNPLTSADGKKISSSGGVDLGACLSPTYISSLPFDPGASGAHWKDSSDYDTGYNVFQDSNGRITVFAPTLEPNLNNTVISITR